jgi:Uma2 family endonuclease
VRTVAAKLTLAEFLRRPETKPASEYENGEVCRKPMPTVWHAVVQRLLGLVFSLYLREHPIGEAGSELRCIFGPPGRERAYVPDYVFIVGAPPGFGPTNGPYYGAPTLVVEILSPTDRMTRVRRKVRFYLENGVRVVWLIDPEDRTVTVLTTPAASTTLGEHEALDGGDVLPGFRVRVSELLPPPATPAT